jgi:hypothetical protein
MLRWRVSCYRLRAWQAFRRFRTALRRLLKPLNDPAEAFPFATVERIGKRIGSFLAVLAE